MIRNIATGVLCAGVYIIFTSCNSKQTEKSSINYVVQGDTINIPSGSNLENKLKLLTIQSVSYSLPILTAGIVKAIPTQYAEIAPPFKGRVTRSYLQLGMKTSIGTPLFEISSPDFMEAQKVFFQERTQSAQAYKNLRRQEDLVAHGVGTKKDLEEAQTAYEMAAKEYENALIGIRLFKADPDKLSLGQPLVVCAPIAGEIIENKVVLGQFIRDDAASIATVAELSQIWIASQVKEKDIRFINKLDECSISVAALPEKQIKGKVYHVNEIVDETTRSIQVLVAVDNKDRTLKPGMYVNVSFIPAPSAAVLVPAKAIMQMSNTSFVFVALAPGRYIKRKVETTGSGTDKVVIQSGLNPGEQIIAEGGFYLLDAQ